MNRLKQLREEKNISMAKIASELNMPYTTYINYEKEYREMNSETMIKIAQYFNVTIDYMLCRTNINDTKSLDMIKNEICNECLNSDKIIIKKYRSLPPEGKKAVDMTLENEITRYKSFNEQVSKEAIKIIKSKAIAFGGQPLDIEITIEDDKALNEVLQAVHTETDEEDYD